MLGMIERGFTVVALLLSMGALLPLFLTGSDAALVEQDSSPIIQAVWACIYVVTCILLARRWRSALWLASRDKSLMLLVLLAVVSIFWSEAPDVTFRRSVALLGTTIFGVYLALRFPAGEQLRLLAWAIGLAAVLSAVCALALPSYGIMEDLHAGAWRGVFIHKNTLGLYMSLGIMVFVLSGQGRYRWVSRIWILPCIALMILSTAKTAVIASSVSVICLVAAKNIKRDMRPVIAIGAAAAILIGAGGVWLANNYEMILTALGRDSTLTGRTSLWFAVLASCAQRPLLGYGYSAFWTGWQGASGTVLSVVGWDAPHAHNGYLDLAVSLGLAGLLLFLYSFAIMFIRAVRKMRLDGSKSDVWLMVFLGFVVMYNASESLILKPNNLMWMMYVMASVTLAAGAKRNVSSLTMARANVGQSR